MPTDIVAAADIVLAASRYSSSSPAVLRKLQQIAHDVAARGIAGDVVECGVFNGASAAVLAAALPDRHVWLYDSFEGLPPAEPIDGPDAPREAGNRVGSVETVKDLLRLAGRDESTYTIQKGWFRDTLAGDPAFEHPIALLHVDADWYASVLECLDALYENVVDGGAIVLDDFGHWEGCRTAFYAFCRQHSLSPLLERFGHSQAWWVKGREHNRHARGQTEMP
jgi:O-methyltransferase